MKKSTLLFNKLEKIKVFFRADRYSQLNSQLLIIREQVEHFVKLQRFNNRPKILYGPLFSTYEPCQIHDFLLTQALMLRGAKIIPLGMGRLERGESVFCGGVWGGYKNDKDKDYSIIENEHFKRVERLENVLWYKIAKLNRLLLSDLLDDKEKNAIRDIVETYDINDYKNWKYDDMPIGKWALDVLRNNYLLLDEESIISYQLRLKNLLLNILLCTHALNNIIKKEKPDIIISNDSFYYPWSILESLAKKENIPFYSYWTPLSRDGACAYAFNDAAMNIDLSLPWKTWRETSLTKEQTAFIDKSLNKRRSGHSMVINTADPFKNNSNIDSSNLNIDKNKPTALLTANVIWDLAALNKEIQFNSMFDWILEVAEFFAERPEWQLVIKPHPVEENKHLPITRQRVKDIVSSKFSNLPFNIFILDAKTTSSLYDFFDFIKVGLVFTSTAGLEMACQGIPVLTAGKSPYYNKGFTYDTKTKEAYFNTLKQLLKSGVTDSDRIYQVELAKKFYLLQHYYYYSRMNFFDYVEGSGKGVCLNVTDAVDLLPGKNLVLDYVCDSILNKLPIVSEGRIPPFIEPKIL